MASIYDATEFSTALKPLLLRFLLTTVPPTITYIDPDIWVHAPLDDLSELATKHGIVLTPHRTVPLPPDDRTPSELDLRSAGVFNLGFVALGEGSAAFLDWWAERLRFDAVRDPAQELFTDQRWIDQVPGYFDHVIVRDKGCNVAYWNLDEREITRYGDRYEVHGVPLRFFHFSGFNPKAPHVLTKHHAGAPRILLSERPAVAGICKEYAALVRAAGYDEKEDSYGYDFLPNGIRIDPFMRRLYRRALLRLDTERDGELLPDPMDPRSVDAFVAWLNAPPDRRRRSVSRYLLAIYEDRPEVQRSFKRVPGRDADAYIDWVQVFGRVEYDIPPELLPPRAATRKRGPQRTEVDRRGINVVGYFRTETGVGEAGRSVLRAVEESGVPYRTVVYDRTLSRQDHPFAERDGAEAYDTNLICINADQLPEFGQEIGPSFFRSRHTIGMWHWEVEEFPWTLKDAFRYVQEVWVASEFIRRAVSKVAPCPVFTFPIPLEVSTETPSLSRKDLGLPEGFMFLFVFDFYSVTKRKNPLAVIDAYRRAFQPTEQTMLVLKTVNGKQKPFDLELVRSAVAAHPDIVLVDEYMDSFRTKELIASADCYVSLHRAEGFGLTMAEAMSVGTPVIATGYSGNLEFMNEANSYLVPYRLVPIGPDAAPYPPHARWAEPNVDAAARSMRAVYDDPAHARQKAAQAREDLERLHSPAARAGFVRERVDIGRRLRTSRPQNADASGRAHRFPAGGTVLHAPARVLLRLLRSPVESMRDPSPRLARIAPVLRRILRRPYRLIWRVGSGLSGRGPDHPE